MRHLIRVHPGSIAKDDGAIEFLHSNSVLQIPVFQGVAVHMHHRQLLQVGCLPSQACGTYPSSS